MTDEPAAAWDKQSPSFLGNCDERAQDSEGRSWGSEGRELQKLSPSTQTHSRGRICS